MNNDQFNKLFTYMTEQFEAVRAEIADVRGTVNRIYNTLDGMVGDDDDLKTELAAHSAQLTRHEQHLTQLADHTGVELSYQ